VSKQWRCAVVGTGVVGSTHVKVLPLLPQAKLVAVCDVKREAAEASLKKAEVSGIPIYTDLAELLKNEDIDVIHLATPSGLHMEPALVAIEAGKHVISEKPLEIKLDRADRIIAAAKKNGTRIACIFQNRWKPENRAIKDAVEQGRFGKIAWAGCFTPWYRPDKYYENDGGWRGTWKFDGGGAIMNQSIHAIDLLQWIAGNVRRVSAYAASRIHPKIETEDTLTCSLQFENGAFGSIMGSTAMFPGQPARMEIGGENGTAISENGLKVFSFRDALDKDKEILAACNPDASAASGKSNPTAIGYEGHRRNLAAIFDSWSSGKDAETHGVEARKAIAIVLAMYESARKDGAPVDAASVSG